MTRPLLAVLLLLCLLWRIPSAEAGVRAVEDDSLLLFLERLEAIVLAGSVESYLGLLAPRADRDAARDFADGSLAESATRAVIKERDRGPLADLPAHAAYWLMVDVFIEQDARARVQTWRLEIEREAGAETALEIAHAWRIGDQARLGAVEGLHRLSLDDTQQYTAVDLLVRAEDLTLHLSRGSVFMVRTDDGVTAAVLLGRGEMAFAPKPAAEREQVKIFSGRETLRTSFDAAFIRLNPHDLEARFTMDRLKERRGDEREHARAARVFEEHVVNSFGLDLRDLSRETWSLVPGSGDFLADVRTRRHDTLTYVRSWGEAEDISLFDRRRRRNIALYASEQKLASRGRYYDEAALSDYHVQHYEVEAAFHPTRAWVEGRTTMSLRIRAYRLATMTIRLAEPLVVHSVWSEQLGRLLHLRVRGQNSVLVSLPVPLARDTELDVTITYAGRIEPQPLSWEALAQAGPPQYREMVVLPPEPSYLYSNRAYWYAQAPVSDYATARLRITVPAEYDVLASGEQAMGSPVILTAEEGRRDRERLFVFSAPQPLRYLACVISRFREVGSTVVALSGPVDTAAGEGNGYGYRAGHVPEVTDRGLFYDSMAVRVEANPRQQGRAQSLGEQAADMAAFYGRLAGDLPYPSFTLAVTESHLPGGHSPAYFAVLHQPVPGAPYLWRHDPVTFEGYASFFMAHEVAHQWWGQAVGWQNYREQWISEAFAQYFAALYARHDRGESTFTNILRQMRRTAIRYADQGPIHLGYRLGHIQGDTRIFRAIVYNKGALVLHMLRRMLGDDVFFRGLRQFYADSRFRRVGTGDVRRAFETAAGVPLDRFFERWVHESDVPTLRFTHRTQTSAEDGQSLLVRFEQTGQIFDLAATVTVTYRSGDLLEFVVPITDRVVESRMPLAGPVRRVEVNRDHAALAEFR